MVSLSLRRVEAGDCQLLWEWANDPLTRQQSLSSASIPWEEHQRWFAHKLQDPACVLLLVLDEHKDPVGQVRFEPDADGRAVISVSIAPSHRGRGLAAISIKQACETLRRIRAPVTIVAYIRRDNLRSQQAFTRAGFAAPEPVDYQGHAMVRQYLELSAPGAA
jgi:RimJ/RimL family protein N-acetyltransferase